MDSGWLLSLVLLVVANVAAVVIAGATLLRLEEAQRTQGERVSKLMENMEALRKAALEEQILELSQKVNDIHVTAHTDDIGRVYEKDGSSGETADADEWTSY